MLLMLAWMERDMPQVKAELTVDLNDEELEKVTGGGGKSATKSDTPPKESVSLTYGEITFSYMPQSSY
jgi:hypothetical protein